MSGAVDLEVSVPCARPACRTPFLTNLGGRGRPRLYCSTECRRAAQLEREAAAARVAHLEDQLRRERHYLASFTATGTTTDTEGAPQ